MKIQGTFERVSPASFVEKAGIPLGWFVISHRWVESKRERRYLHGKWFKLSSTYGSIYRVLRFSANLTGAPGKQGQLVIDYPAWLDLNGRAENVSGSLEVSLAPVKWWEAPKLAVAHPDPSFRLAGWLAIISVAMGLISLALGGWSIWLTYTSQ